MGSRAVDGVHAVSRPDVPPARLRSMRSNGPARESRCDVPARSAEADDACRRIHSCHLLAGSAMGSALDPAPKSSSHQHYIRQQAPDRPPNMTVIHRQPRRSRPVGRRARSLSAVQMARSSEGLCQTDSSRTNLREPRATKSMWSRFTYLPQNARVPGASPCTPSGGLHECLQIPKFSYFKPEQENGTRLPQCGGTPSIPAVCEKRS